MSACIKNCWIPTLSETFDGSEACRGEVLLNLEYHLAHPSAPTQWRVTPHVLKAFEAAAVDVDRAGLNAMRLKHASRTRRRARVTHKLRTFNCALQDGYPSKTILDCSEVVQTGGCLVIFAGGPGRLAKTDEATSSDQLSCSCRP